MKAVNGYWKDWKLAENWTQRVVISDTKSRWRAETRGQVQKQYPRGQYFVQSYSTSSLMICLTGRWMPLTLCQRIVCCYPEGPQQVGEMVQQEPQEGQQEVLSPTLGKQQPQVSFIEKGSWIRWFTEVLSNLNQFVILWLATWRFSHIFTVAKTCSVGALVLVNVSGVSLSLRIFKEM